MLVVARDTRVRWGHFGFAQSLACRGTCALRLSGKDRQTSAPLGRLGSCRLGNGRRGSRLGSATEAEPRRDAGSARSWPRQALERRPSSVEFQRPPVRPTPPSLASPPPPPPKTARNQPNSPFARLGGGCRGWVPAQYYSNYYNHPNSPNPRIKTPGASGLGGYVYLSAHFLGCVKCH